MRLKHTFSNGTCEWCGCRAWEGSKSCRKRASLARQVRQTDKAIRLPGCLPDSEPNGPFATQEDALSDAQDSDDYDFDGFDDYDDDDTEVSQ